MTTPYRRALAVAVALVVATGVPGTAAAAPAVASPTVAAIAAFPTATGEQTVTATVAVSGVLDGALTRYVAVGLGDGGRDGDQQPVFRLRPGATLRNVIIGAPGADGVHCEATCTLENVWWEDVGEDAATLLGSAPADAVMTVDGGGARLAYDKVFQHNGPGMVIIRGFEVDDFGKLYRSCGNCRNGYQGARTVVVDDVTARTGRNSLVGINTNYGDTARLTRITVVGDPGRRLAICERYIGNDTGAQPVKLGSGPGGGCDYTTADVTYR